MAPNKTFVYKKRPAGVPVPGEHLVTETRDTDLDSPPQGGLVLDILYASLDPYLRGKMRDPSIKSYMPAFAEDDAVSNATLARVLKSDRPGFQPGDLVTAYTPIAEYARVDGDAVPTTVTKVANPHGLDAALFLGPLGMPGLTAWAGLHKIGRPRRGETLFVSSAAGAVGQMVGQIAKHEGLTVVGSVGSDEKLAFITDDLGFDAGFNYRKERPAEALRRLAPDGIDIYFENVGGDHLEAALANMKPHGRIAACGMISDYNQPADKRQGIKNLILVVSRQLTIQGFVVTNPEYGPAYAQEHQQKMQEWLADGSVKAKLSVTEGIDNAADCFVGMLQGKNFGKAVLKVK